MRKINDPVYQTGTARIEVMIDTYGLHAVLSAVLSALENIERDHNEENHEFEGSQHQKNIEHQKRVIEAAMGGVDLDTRYGYAEARKVAGERFNEEMKRIGRVA
ncbi:MAG: hypothetical protein K2P74_04425 [Nitrosomonas sp.]|nr:hypothetical protein [Nitrosomonas sp.]